MNCDVCGKQGARIRRMTQSFGSGRTMFLIEEVPVVCCRSCGESYLTAKTLAEIEHIRKHRKTLAVPRRVPVAKFKGAA